MTTKIKNKPLAVTAAPASKKSFLPKPAEIEPDNSLVAFVKPVEFFEAFKDITACLCNNVVCTVAVTDSKLTMTTLGSIDIVVNGADIEKVKAIRCKSDYKRGGFSVYRKDKPCLVILPLRISLVYELLHPVK